ncbi:hypothetical protein HDU80_003584 [Chytriomyces hyalinus]|nr:hypothetical protein HDU80_003584 [Chytriomyces hyalinus]
MDQSHEKRNRTVTTCFACGSSAFGNSAAVVPAAADPSTAAVRNARRGAAASQSVCGPCVYSSTAASLSATAALETESARNEADITWLLQSRGVFTSTGVHVNRHRNCRHSDSVTAAIASLRTRIESDRVKLAAAKETLLARKAGLARARDHAHALVANKNQTLLTECRATNEKLLRSNEVATTCRRMLMRELVGVFRLRRVQRASSTSLAPTSSTSPANMSFNFQNSASPISAQRSEFAPHSIEQSTSTSNLSPSTPTAYSLPSAMEAHKAMILETPELQASPNAKIAVSLFYDTPLEFRLINVGFSCFGDYYLYPREKFNAALGHIVHMVIVMCHYLGVTLPFQLVYGGSKSLIKPGVVDVHTLLGTRSENADGVSGISSSLPLFLDSNVDLFTIGLTLLNYDILYLCQTQGVTIPLHLGANTLENLAACCRATKLGRDINHRVDILSRLSFAEANSSTAQQSKSASSRSQSKHPPTPKTQSKSSPASSPGKGGKRTAESNSHEPEKSPAFNGEALNKDAKSDGSLAEANENKMAGVQFSVKTLYSLHAALRKRAKPTPTSATALAAANAANAAAAEAAATASKSRTSQSSKKTPSRTSVDPMRSSVTRVIDTATSGVSRMGSAGGITVASSAAAAGEIASSFFWAASTLTQRATRIGAEAVSIAANAALSAATGGGTADNSSSSGHFVSRFAGKSQEEDIEGGMGIIIVDEDRGEGNQGNQTAVPDVNADGDQPDEDWTRDVDNDNEEFGLVVSREALAASKGSSASLRPFVRVDPGLLALVAVIDRADSEAISAGFSDDESGSAGVGGASGLANEWLIL